jgi:hypothetical protein
MCVVARETDKRETVEFLASKILSLFFVKNVRENREREREMDI